MAPSATRSSEPPHVGGGRFAGVTRTGLTIVVVTGLLNATRRSIIDLQADPFAEWIVEWLQNLAGSLFIAAAMLLVVLYAASRYPARTARQYTAIGAAIAASSVGTWTLVYALERRWAATQVVAVPQPEWSFWAVFAGSFRHAVVGGLIAGAWLYFRAEEDSAAAAHECDVEAAQLDAQAAQAHLQVLEAQIEPHYLFNVLATVKRLFETDTTSADRMLDNLLRYLTTALPQMRTSGSTLGREASLAEAYLDIQKIRMGRRLAHRSTFRRRCARHR